MDGRDGRLTLGALFKIVVAVFVGVLLGLLLTIRSLEFNRAGIAVGPWHSTPRDGSGDIDPYALAATARDGALPLGVAEGLSFFARTDGDGAPFQPRCDYTVKGPMPPTRYWTLSLLDARGFPVANPADRHGFTSAEVLRYVGTPVQVIISAEARSGNWLPSTRAPGYMLMLRLYDTSLSTGRTTFDDVKMPSITRGDCS